MNGFGVSGITWDTDGLLVCTETLGGEGLFGSGLLAMGLESETVNSLHVVSHRNRIYR